MSPAHDEISHFVRYISSAQQSTQLEL